MMSHRAPRRRGAARDEAPEAGLDDLLGAAPDLTADPAPGGRSRRNWYAKAVLQTFLVSAVVYTLLRAGSLAPPYPLILAVCAGAILVRRAVVATGESRQLSAAQVVRQVAGRKATDESADDVRDGMLDAIRRWERRLDWGSAAPLRFSEVMAWRLGELADERLRQCYGITRSTDPQRARALLGEQLWRMLHDESSAAPPRHDIATAVRRLERL